jgi:hypothetical protein
MRPLSRRRFLAWLGAAGVVPARSRARAAAAAAPGARERLRALLADPPFSARPMTRWWWFGGAVTPEEVTRELTLMRDAGLRGAEIQPLYPIAPDDPARGIRNVPYFTDAFLGVLRHAVREARRLGLQLDFTLGSGWPYGGPFIPTALSARRLRTLTQDVAGPRAIEWALAPHLTGDDRLVAVVAAPVADGQQPDLQRARVLPGPRSGGGDEALALRFTAPEGEWRVTAVIDSPTGQQVKRPTLGMEGPVIDHHDREAMQLFLRAAGDHVLGALREAGDPPFHSVFCDSLEVYGADWTRDLLAQFRARRGYDLAPYLPALWQDAGAVTAHVRYDYHAVLSDLMLEHCFEPLVAWSERHGMTARIQAHGALADVMRAYGAAHVPEGENIFGGDTNHVNLRHRRLASSAAHLYGRPLVSAETYTWLRTPLFMTTLEMMKAATDSVFLDGVNHVVNHGYSYSPPQAGEPGWAFYASTEINHTNTWWRHYPHLARYVRHAQALLQQGVAVNPVAVYLPLADVFAAFGAGGIHLDVEVERRLGADLPTALRRGGYDFDLVNDHALAERARVGPGRLECGTAAYRVVVVPGVRLMPVESAARLAEFARQGGHVVFVDRLPEAAPGLHEQAARTAALQRLWADALGGAPPGPGGAKAVGAGSVALAADREAAVRRVAAVLPPDFEIVAGGAAAGAREDVGFVHRRWDEADLFFVANVSEHPRDLRVRFAAGHRSPERWDLERGTAHALAYAYVRDAAGRRTEVELPLEPFESCAIVFGAAAARPRAARTETRRPGPAIGVRGPWTLRLGEGPPLALDALRSWTELPGGERYSGWATYETAFEAPPPLPDAVWELDLGTVHETAEAWLNGRPLGAAWKRPRRLPCAGALRAGRNTLRVEVANLWIHAMAGRPAPEEWKTLEETVGIRWGRYGERAPDAIPPAGLLGPVRLLPYPRRPAAP